MKGFLNRLLKAFWPQKLYVCSLAVMGVEGTTKPVVFAYMEWACLRLDPMEIQLESVKRTGYPCIFLGATRVGAEERGIHLRLLNHFQQTEKNFYAKREHQMRFTNLNEPMTGEIN